MEARTICNNFNIAYYMFFHVSHACTCMMYLLSFIFLFVQFNMIKILAKDESLVSKSALSASLKKLA